MSSSQSSSSEAKVGVLIIPLGQTFREVFGRPALQWVLEACCVFGKVMVPTKNLADHARLLKLIENSSCPQAELLTGLDLAEQLEGAQVALEGCARFIIMRGDLPLVTREQLESTLYQDIPLSLMRISVLSAMHEPDNILDQINISAQPAAWSRKTTWSLGIVIGCRGSKGIMDAAQSIASSSSTDAPQAEQFGALRSSLIAVSDPALHAVAALQMRRRMIFDMQQSGVEIQDPGSLVVEPDVHVQPGAKLGVGVQLYGRILIQEGSVVEGPSYLRNANVGPHCHIKPFSHLEDCSIAAGCQIGPYARVRPGADLAEKVFLGNFVEVKNSRMGANSQASHLAYIGDADVGQNALVAAGCITCNFDGKQKHRTRIGDSAFVGSNSTMVAPVEIGEKATVAAGSVITESVPANSLGIGRSRQTIKDDYVNRAHRQ